MASEDCGGCRGEGAHRKYCEAVVGPVAQIYGRWAQQVEGIGDSCGMPEAANMLWSAAGYLSERAEVETGRYLQRQRDD